MGKLTENDLKAKIKKTEFIKIGRKTTICLATIVSGFEIVTSSACVNEDDFDYEIGKKIAYNNLINKLWELEGYLVQNNTRHHFYNCKHCGIGFDQLNFQELGTTPEGICYAVCKECIKKNEREDSQNEKNIQV